MKNTFILTDWSNLDIVGYRIEEKKPCTLFFFRKPKISYYLWIFSHFVEGGWCYWDGVRTSEKTILEKCPEVVIDGFECFYKPKLTLVCKGGENGLFEVHKYFEDSKDLRKAVSRLNLGVDAGDHLLLSDFFVGN
jgi:hypothetical protein